MRKANGKHFLICFVCAVFLMLALFFQVPTLNVVAEQSTTFPIDDALISAISLASGGYDAENPNILDYEDELDLSGKSIYSIENLNYWLFPNLITLDLSDNQISEINAIDFSTMPLLETLNISSNSLSSVSLTGLALKAFLADNNALSSISLNFFADVEGTYASLNSNEFDDLISIENSTNLNKPTVWLSCNELLTATDIPINYELVIQGVTDSKKFVTQGSAILYASLSIPNLVVKAGEEVLGLGQIQFVYGSYDISFFDGTLPLAALYPLQNFSFSVIPAKATIKYFIDNEEVEYQAVFTKEVKLVFETDVPNAVIFFRLGTGAWAQGNELLINQTGNFSVSSQVRISGVASDNQSTMANVRLVSPIWFFMGFFTFIAIVLAGFFGFYYFKRSRSWKR